MEEKNNFVFKGLKIVAWIIFVGLCIEAGGLIVNFVFSLYRPDFVHNLYQKLDLTPLYQNNIPAFFGIYSLILSIAVLKAYLFYVVVMLMHKMDLSNPSSDFVAKKVLSISYFTLCIGLLSYITRQSAKNLKVHGLAFDNLSQFYSDGQAFVLMAAVIYIIAVIFKKGVLLQRENDLTV